MAQAPQFLHIDAFTARPFAGNAAAVVLLDRPAAGPWMQSLADDMNLSETAYVVRPAEPGLPWGLRWFTPAAEVELCGHATLASTHALLELGLAERGTPIRFATRFSGELVCTADDDGHIAMDFPADPPRPAEPPARLIEALEVDPVAVTRSTYDWIVELATADEVAAAAPRFADLAAVPDTRGVALTAAGALASVPEADFVSRFFAPSLRVDEDPVTGALHCILGPMWAQRLGKASLVGHQCSRRGGVVRVTHEAPDALRVTLAGQAVTLVRGTLATPVDYA
ncbi:MAG: PhzF family phenazine biosynthesis protein [Planctomycetota bacterium]